MRICLNLIFCLLVCLGFSGCELAGLEGAAGVEGVGAAGEVGDAAALGRTVGVDGTALNESQAVTLNRAASTRAVAGLGIGRPLSEEVAIIRGSAQVLSFPDTYPLARIRDLTVMKTDNSLLVSIRRFDTRLVVRNRDGKVVGESIINGNRIEHYTDSTHQTKRGYSIVDGMTLKHWLYDLDGNAIYCGSERIQIPSGTPPDNYVIPDTVLAAILGNISNNKQNSAGIPGEYTPRLTPWATVKIPPVGQNQIANQQTDVAKATEIQKNSKQLGDLLVRIESLKFTGDQNRGFFILATVIFVNMNASSPIQIALNGDSNTDGICFNAQTSLINNRGDKFLIYSGSGGVSGVGIIKDLGNGDSRGSFTEIPAKDSIVSTIELTIPYARDAGEYPPYRFQSEIFAGIEENGRYVNVKKHNFVIDVDSASSSVTPNTPASYYPR